MNIWGIPSLRPDRLSVCVPERVYAGGAVRDPAQTLFLWRTAALSQAQGMTVGFYVWDDRFKALWRNPERYTALFLQHQVAALMEPDFSLWADAPLVEQLWNTYRTRWLGRYWQEAGLNVIPSLNWSDARSYSFAFTGIPVGAPVVAVECRTAGQTDEDRRAFLAGLAEGVQQVQPQHVVIYGGKEHAFWLEGRLPGGPGYTLVESWNTARERQRKKERDRYQLNLFPQGGTVWAAEGAHTEQAVVAQQAAEQCLTASDGDEADAGGRQRAPLARIGTFWQRATGCLYALAQHESETMRMTLSENDTQ